MGGYAGVGRVRVSTHLYNTEEDVELLPATLRDLPESLKEWHPQSAIPG